LLFFFSSRRRHTRSKRDWSSDVCSSDLSFFVRYATLDEFDPSERQVPVSDRPLMDRWLLSTLARLVAESRASMDAYDVRTVVFRSEERRVGKECRSRGAQGQERRTCKDN